jgi:hypothetical protein
MVELLPALEWMLLLVNFIGSLGQPFDSYTERMEVMRAQAKETDKKKKKIPHAL